MDAEKRSSAYVRKSSDDFRYVRKSSDDIRLRQVRVCEPQLEGALPLASDRRVQRSVWLRATAARRGHVRVTA